MSSAAPISLEIVKFLATFDIPLFELLGTSECTGPGTANNANAWKVFIGVKIVGNMWKSS